MDTLFTGSTEGNQDQVIVIGDVHGHFGAYELLCKRFDQPTLQLGDMGVGFPDGKGPHLGPTDYFFRGNHDNPKAAAKYANHLGDGGVAKSGSTKFFYVPGAWSIDHFMRKKGISWWPDEELSMGQLTDLVDLYEVTKPDLMITHDAPASIAEQLLNRYTIGNPRPIYKTRTGQALQAMFEIHQPKRWIFGHYHTDWKKTVNGTEFQCLNELSWVEV